MNIYEWNKKIYKDKDDNFVVEPKLEAQELWDEFKIKSYPLFKNACFSHVPSKWADDVRRLLKEAQQEFGDKITFLQIKEKWCELTIYIDAEDHVKEKFYKLKKECVERLKTKGVHP